MVDAREPVAWVLRILRASRAIAAAAVTATLLPVTARHALHADRRCGVTGLAGLASGDGELATVAVRVGDAAAAIAQRALAVLFGQTRPAFGHRGQTNTLRTNLVGSTIDGLEHLEGAVGVCDAAIAVTCVGGAIVRLVAGPFARHTPACVDAHGGIVAVAAVAATAIGSTDPVDAVRDATVAACIRNHATFGSALASAFTALAATAVRPALVAVARRCAVRKWLTSVPGAHQSVAARPAGPAAPVAPTFASITLRNAGTVRGVSVRRRHAEPILSDRPRAAECRRVADDTLAVHQGRAGPASRIVFSATREGSEQCQQDADTSEV